MVKKLKAFFYIAWHSIVDPPYYKKLLTVKASFSVKYLFALFFLLSFLGGVWFAIRLLMVVPFVPKVIQQAKASLTTLYPANLVVTYTNGTISTNQKEPYAINFPKEVTSLIASQNQYKYLVTIDTKARLEDFAKYQSVILITKNAAIYPDDNHGYKVQPFETPGNFIVNKTLYDSVVSKILPYLDYLPGFMTGLAVASVLLFPFFVALGLLFWHLAYLVFGAFAVWILAKVLKRNIPYGKLYQLSMHGITAALLLTLVLGLAGIHIPLLFTGIFLFWMAVILSQLKVKKVSSR